MKIIQTISNTYDFQSRVIETNENYNNWYMFKELIFEHAESGKCIPDSDVIISSIPLAKGNLIPDTKSVTVVQNTNYHLMIRCRRLDESIETFMFYRC